MFIAIVVGCLTAEDPEPQDCMPATGRKFFPTVEACEQDAVTAGQDFLNRSGYMMMEVKCVHTDTFGLGRGDA